MGPDGGGERAEQNSPKRTAHQNHPGGGFLFRLSPHGWGPGRCDGSGSDGLGRRCLLWRKRLYQIAGTLVIIMTVLFFSVHRQHRQDGSTRAGPAPCGWLWACCGRQGRDFQGLFRRRAMDCSPLLGYSRRVCGLRSCSFLRPARDREGRNGPAGEERPRIKAPSGTLEFILLSAILVWVVIPGWLRGAGNHFICGRRARRRAAADPSKPSGRCGMGTSLDDRGGSEPCSLHSRSARCIQI